MTLGEEPARCYFCDGPVSTHNYCHGCNEYVCIDCRRAIFYTKRPHGVEAHQGRGVIGARASGTGPGEKK